MSGVNPNKTIVFLSSKLTYMHVIYSITNIHDSFDYFDNFSEINHVHVPVKY